MKSIVNSSTSTITLKMTDGTSNAVNIFSPEHTTPNTPLLIIFPALGVKGAYYEPLALAFASQHTIAVTTDWRGNGASSIRPSCKVNFGFKQLLEDYELIFDELRKNFPHNPLYVLGHSLGGQLASLFLSTRKYGQQGLLLIASGSPYYKGWRGIERWALLFLTQLARLIATSLGYFPGKSLGFGGLEAQGVIKDWSLVCRTGKYTATGDSINYEQALSQLDIPTFVLSFEGDKMSIPASNANLYQKFKQEKSAVSYTHLRKSDERNEGFDHFNWVKKPKNIVEIIKEWMTE